MLVHVAGEPSVAYTAPYECLRLASIATVLERQGFSVRLVDTALEPDGWEVGLRSSVGAEAVVVDALFRTMESALAFGSELRGRGTAGKVILVGDAARGSAVHILQSCPQIDAVVLDDPETIVPELVRSFRTREVPPGVVVRGHDGSVLTTARRSPRSSPAGCPPLRPHATTALSSRPVLDVVSSSGCASRCSFCMIGSAFTDGVSGGATERWRPRAAADVAAEVQELVRRYGVRRFHFADDNFIGAPRVGALRAYELAAMLEPMEIAFSFYCRADSVEPVLFEALYRAGLRQVHLGIESGNDATLRRLRKDQALSEVENALVVLRELGIRIVPSFITFEARQTLTDLVDGLRWMQHWECEVGFSVGGCIPLPGTILLDELRAAELVVSEPGWRQAFAEVGFTDDRVARVAATLREFERRLEQRAPGRISALATAYHRCNDDLAVASLGGTDAGDEDHLRFRRMEVQLALATAAAVDRDDDSLVEDLVERRLAEWSPPCERAGT